MRFCFLLGPEVVNSVAARPKHPKESRLPRFQRLAKQRQQSMYPFEIPWVQYDAVKICSTHNIHRVRWFSLEALGWISTSTIDCQHQVTCAATFQNVAKKVKSAWCRKPLDYTSTKRKCKKFKLAHCLDPSWGQWISKYVTSLDIN